MQRKTYQRPVLHTEPLEIGVFGDYGDGSARPGRPGDDQTYFTDLVIRR